MFQAGDRRGQAQSDGRSVVDQANLDFIQKTLQNGMVQGQGTLGEGFGGEHHQADAIGGAAVDESPDHFLGGFQSIQGVEIQGPHTTADVQGQYDVDPLSLHLLTVVGNPWSGGGNNQQYEPKSRQYRQHGGQARPETGALFTQQPQPGMPHGGRIAPLFKADP